jgi:hypothetical protein
LQKRNLRQLYVRRRRQKSAKLRSADKLMHAKLKERRIRKLATLPKLYNCPKEVRGNLQSL